MNQSQCCESDSTEEPECDHVSDRHSSDQLPIISSSLQHICAHERTVQIISPIYSCEETRWDALMQISVSLTPSLTQMNLTRPPGPGPWNSFSGIIVSFRRTDYNVPLWNTIQDCESREGRSAGGPNITTDSGPFIAGAPYLHRHLSYAVMFFIKWHLQTPCWNEDVLQPQWGTNRRLIVFLHVFRDVPSTAPLKQVLHC